MVLQNQMVLQNRKTLQNQMALQQNNLSLFQQDKTREWDKTRIPLDALKGIAILGIVLYHAFPNYVPGGFLGVPLFFVLSGYLMFTSTLQKWLKWFLSYMLLITKIGYKKLCSHVL